MKQTCNDVFSEYNLPLETYFFDCQNHQTTTHSDLEIIWVLKGKATLTINSQPQTMHAQTVFLVYFNQPHTLIAEKDTIIIAYRLKNDYLHRRGLFFEKIPYKGEVLTFDYLVHKYRQVPLLLVQFMKLLLSNEDTDMIYYKIIAYYNFYITEIYKLFLKDIYLDIKTLNYDAHLLRSQMIVDYIYKHYQEPITLKDLQKKITLSESRLSHLIKETFEVSFQTLVKNIRFERALTLLKTTKFTIEEIVKLSGFSDQKYLNQMMKKQLHTTALKYRKNHQHKMHYCHSINKGNQPFLNEIRACLIALEKNPRFKKLFEMEPIQECIYETV